MSHSDQGRAARASNASPADRTPESSGHGRFHVPAMRGSASALRRGGSALAGTALAAGLLVGGSPAAQAQQARPVQSPASFASVARTGHQSAVRQRIAGITRDLDRAVAAGDVTREQADAFFTQLVRRIAG